MKSSADGKCYYPSFAPVRQSAPVTESGANPNRRTGTAPVRQFLAGGVGVERRTLLAQETGAFPVLRWKRSPAVRQFLVREIIDGQKFQNFKFQNLRRASDDYHP